MYESKATYENCCKGKEMLLSGIASCATRADHLLFCWQLHSGICGVLESRGLKGQRRLDTTEGEAIRTSTWSLQSWRPGL